MAVDEVGFQRMLGRVREFHQRVSELGLSTSGIDANIRVRLHSHPHPPALPPGQTKLANEIVELLEDPRLSSWQTQQLERAFFLGK